MNGFKDKLINIIANIILFPVMLPIWFAGMVFGLALYIFDKKNKGLEASKAVLSVLNNF